MSCIYGGGRDRAWGSQDLGAGAGLREGGRDRRGRKLLNFPQGLSKRSFWARLGCSPIPMTKVSFLPPPHSLPVSFLPPQQAWLLAELGFQSGEGLQEWGWACGMPEVIFSALGHVPGYDLIASVPEVGCGLRNGADGNAHSC